MVLFSLLILLLFLAKLLLEEEKDSLENFISYINIFTTAQSEKWQNAERKAARLVGAAPPSKEGEKGSVIRICPKVPNLYIRLPLLAYITEFQILPSVYDAVKKTGLFR